MLSFFVNDEARVSMCFFHLYFESIVSPSSDMCSTLGMGKLVEIVLLHECFLQMCRCLHFVRDNDEPECAHHSLMLSKMSSRFFVSCV